VIATSPVTARTIEAACGSRYVSMSARVLPSGEGPLYRLFSATRSGAGCDRFSHSSASSSVDRRPGPHRSRQPVRRIGELSIGRNANRFGNVFPAADQHRRLRDGLRLNTLNAIPEPGS